MALIPWVYVVKYCSISFRLPYCCTCRNRFLSKKCVICPFCSDHQSSSDDADDEVDDELIPQVDLSRAEDISQAGWINNITGMVTAFIYSYIVVIKLVILNNIVGSTDFVNSFRAKQL